MENLKISLAKYIDIIKPITSKIEDNKIRFLIFNEKIFDLNYSKPDLNEFQFSFYQKFEVISPDKKLFNYHCIQYSRLPMENIDIIDIRHIIIKIKKNYLVFTVNSYHDYFSIIFNIKKNNSFKLNFKNLNEIKIRISFFENINDFYKTTTKKTNLLPLWTYGIGFILDLAQNKTEKINFAEIKEKLNNNNFYVILKHWENLYSYFTKEKIQNISLLIKKLILSKINFIFQYNNNINHENFEDQNVLRLRSGKLASENYIAPMDYFNKEGEFFLKNIYTRLLNLQSSGIYISPSYFYFTDREIYDKTICKTEGALLPYSQNVQRGLSIINKIIYKLKNNENIFLTNVFSPHTDNCVFLKKYDTVFNNNLIIIEDLYKQGFTNFAFYINFDDIRNTLRLEKHFLILLISLPVFFNEKFIKDIPYSGGTINKIFLDILHQRIQLRIIHENLILNFKEKGMLPFKNYYTNEEISGFFMSDGLFCSFVENKLLDTVFALPEGKWFCLENNTIADGKGIFSNKGVNELYHLFQKEGTIHLYINPLKYDNSFNYQSLEFIIFCKTSIDNDTGELQIENLQNSIIERKTIENRTVIIRHELILSYQDNKILITYSNDSEVKEKKLFKYKIILPGYNFSKILCNDKKIFYKKSAENVYEFEIMKSNEASLITINKS